MLPGRSSAMAHLAKAINAGPVLNLDRQGVHTLPELVEEVV